MVFVSAVICVYNPGRADTINKSRDAKSRHIQQGKSFLLPGNEQQVIAECIPKMCKTPSAMLAELRTAAAAATYAELSGPAKDCSVCQSPNVTPSCPVNEEECASLKTTKRTADSDRKQGIVLRVFECGHVYKHLSRVSRDIRGPRKTTKGMCGECWRHIASDRRRILVDREHGGRRGASGRSCGRSYGRPKADNTRYKKQRAKFRVWVIRGPVGRKAR
ncbi:hypothetical protein GGR50DRAFT_221003 [Xylaria sp. CBS 124048]|nr:hypothetical protein GGR50DRAFT_221003 [Xylaria sp. CBS 124048]